jgi:hypothetical protein
VIQQPVLIGIVILPVIESGSDNAGGDFIQRSTVLVLATQQLKGLGHRRRRPTLHLRRRYGATPFSKSKNTG